MAEVTLERLAETDQEAYPSNTLTDYYDSIHKLLEAIALERGFKAKGEGAHQQLIGLLAREGYINEAARIFLQEMREHRNRIAYEGFSVPASYVRQNRKRIHNIIERLRPDDSSAA